MKTKLLKYIVGLQFLLSITLVEAQCTFKLDSINTKNTRYQDFKTDRTRIYFLDTTTNLKLVVNFRAKEYFTADDTLLRDHLLMGGQKLNLDKFCGLKQNSYTGAFDLISYSKLMCSGKEYLILELVDGFPMGTDQQTDYIILELLDFNWKYHSSYENGHDKPTSDVRVIKKGNGIKLKGKYLKRIKKIASSDQN